MTASGDPQSIVLCTLYIGFFCSWCRVGLDSKQVINFVFPSSAFIESSSRWGSDSNSGDDGCLEKVIDL